MGSGSSSPTAAASLHPHPFFVFRAPTLLFFLLLLLVTRSLSSSCLSATAADHDRSSHQQTTSTGSPAVSNDQEDIKAENFEYFIHHRPAPQPAEQQYYYRRAHQQPRPGVEHKPHLLPRGDHASRSRQQQQQAQCEYTVTIRTSCSSPDAGVDCNARIQLVFTDNLGQSVTVNNNLQGKCRRCSVLDISVRGPCLNSICALNLFHDARDDWTPLYVMVSRSDVGHPPVLFCVDKPLPQKRFSYSDCGRDLAALPTGASNVAIRTIVDAGGIRRDDDGGCADVGVYVRG